MALALQSVVRSQDAGLPGVASMKLSEIVPKDWHNFPGPIEPSDPAYVPVVPITDGQYGDDIDTATASTTDPYAPMTQAEKAAMMEPPLTLVEDVGVRRGDIAPNQPYPIATDTPPDAPTADTIAPATAVAGVGPSLWARITGTGFSPWSLVQGGADRQAVVSSYVSPTEIDVLIDPARSVAGTVQFTVHTGSQAAAPVDFVFT